MTITIYTTASCSYCALLENYLSSKNIVFTKKIISEDDSAQKEMANISGGYMGVPFTVITNDNGSKTTILGFDKGKLDSLIK